MVSNLLFSTGSFILMMKSLSMGDEVFFIASTLFYVGSNINLLRSSHGKCK